jgi:hypothetical protein
MKFTFLLLAITINSVLIMYNQNEHTKQLNFIESKLDSLNSRLDIGIPIKAE